MPIVFQSHSFHCILSSLHQTLYTLLPALLETNPFSREEKEKEQAKTKESKSGEGEAEGGEGRGAEGEEEDDVSTLPPTVAGLVEVYRCSLQLTRDACLSPPLTSQTFGYLFFFTNTSLLNTLLERGNSLLVTDEANCEKFGHGNYSNHSNCYALH